MSHASATSWVQVPTVLRKAPVQSLLKLGMARADAKPGRRASQVVPVSDFGGSVYCGVAFPCPGCGAPVSGSLELGALRCGSCAALLRSSVASDDGETRSYDVAVSGRPETRRRVFVPWDARQERRLSTWLLWATLLTLGSIVALFALARFWR